MGAFLGTWLMLSILVGVGIGPFLHLTTEEPQ